MSQRAEPRAGAFGNEELGTVAAALLFAVVVATWGINWPMTKAIVEHVPPIWSTAMRFALAIVVLLVLQLAQGSLVLPKRGDVPILFAIGILHMTLFTGCMSLGLKLVPASRAIVLGYTTPLWVIPGAVVFLREPLTRWRVIGVAVGLAGLGVMFNPLSFDWADTRALTGNAIIMMGALCWAISILMVRGHRWVSTPFQLVIWEALLATVLLGLIAYAVEGPPHVTWSPALVLMLGYSGIVATALGYWAMAMVNRSLPAMTTSLGLLATPAVGAGVSALAFGEQITASLITAMVLIICGIAVGSLAGK